VRDVERFNEWGVEADYAVMEYGRKVDCLRPDRAGEEIGTCDCRTSKGGMRATDDDGERGAASKKQRTGQGDGGNNDNAEVDGITVAAGCGEEGPLTMRGGAVRRSNRGTVQRGKNSGRWSILSISPCPRTGRVTKMRWSGMQQPHQPPLLTILSMGATPPRHQPLLLACQPMGAICRKKEMSWTLAPMAMKWVPLAMAPRLPLAYLLCNNQLIFQFSDKDLRELGSCRQ
jgi:hypothetical protein